MSEEIMVRFEGVSVADANVLAAELKEQLLDSTRDLEIKTKRERSDAMDFGSTLILILSAKAVVEVAKGIAAWLAKRGTGPEPATIEIVTKQGKVLVKNAPGVDVRALVESTLRKVV